MEDIQLYIEALIFSSEEPISITDLTQIINEVENTSYKNHEIEGHLESLISRYESNDFSMKIVPIAQGFQFMTKQKYHDLIHQKIKEEHKKRLSKAAMETLAIIAYKQPVEKTEVEFVRGVNCDYTIRKLLDKDLVEIAGRSDKPGRPLIYRTSERFMNYFGINGVKDLPKPKDFDITDNEIGDIPEIEEYLKEEE